MRAHELVALLSTAASLTGAADSSLPRGVGPECKTQQQHDHDNQRKQ